MNYPTQQFEKLVSNLEIIMKHYGINNNIVLADTANIGLLHNLHFRVFANVNYTEDNANVIKKEDGTTRLLKQDEMFLLYPEKCNDDQIETAMKKAFKILSSKL